MDPVPDPFTMIQSPLGDFDETGVEDVQRAGDLGDFVFDIDGSTRHETIVHMFAFETNPQRMVHVDSCAIASSDTDQGPP